MSEIDLKVLDVSFYKFKLTPSFKQKFKANLKNSVKNQLSGKNNGQLSARAKQFAKVLKNAISIDLDREQFSPGDIVRGTINFELRESLPIGCVKFTVNGNEKAMF